MSKGKAQAFEEESNLSASDLAADEKTGDSSIIGYEFGKVDGDEIIKFVALNEFTGEENLLPVKYDPEVLVELKRTVADNKKSLRKMNVVDRTVFSILWAASGVSLMGSMVMVGVSSQSNSVPTGLGISFVSALVISALGFAVWERLRLRVLPKFYPLRKAHSKFFEGVLKSEQGFKSLISGNRFKIGSPSHETLREAVKLLNAAWVLNDTLRALEERHTALEYKHKNSEQRREVAELEAQISELESKLQDTEEQVKDLLLRNDD